MGGANNSGAQRQHDSSTRQHDSSTDGRDRVITISSCKCCIRFVRRISFGCSCRCSSVHEYRCVILRFGSLAGLKCTSCFFFRIYQCASIPPPHSWVARQGASVVTFTKLTVVLHASHSFTRASTIMLVLTAL